MHEPKIVFLHIPKTGGQSLRRIAESNYDGEERFACYPSNPKYPDLDDLLKLDSEQKARLRLISGHLDFGLHEKVDYPCRYFAMMRHPVERVISAYQHILRRNPKCEGFSLLKIFESKRTLLDNHQTRILSGRNPSFDQCGEEMVWEAIDNIERWFTFVGINEAFSESVAALGRRLGWHTLEGDRINVTPSKRARDTFSKTEIDRIVRHNRLDLMLYSYVKRRIQSELSQTAEAVESKA